MTNSNNNLMNQHQSLNGLILGGGGSKGSYTAGVWKALDECNLHFDIVAGTSIGALVGALYTAENLEGTLEMIGEMNEHSVVKNPLIFPAQYVSMPLEANQFNAFIQAYSQGGPSFDPLETIFLKFFDFQSFQSSSIDYACMTWNASANEARVFKKSEMTEQNFLPMILASASYFPAYNFTEIDGDFYIDGSFAQIVPWKTGLEMGASNLTIVSLAQPGVDDHLPEDQGFTIIRPLLKLAYSMDFDGDILKQQVSQGYLEGLKYLNHAVGYLYTFKLEDWPEIETICKLGQDLLNTKGIQISQEILNEIWKGLLGYVPRTLNNRFMTHYEIMYIIEALGICAGVSFYEMYSLRDFLNQILNNLSHLSNTPFPKTGNGIFSAMEMRGIQDLIVFFHSAFTCFGKDLPSSFDALKKGEYLLPYYLAAAWVIIEKSRWVWRLI